MKIKLIGLTALVYVALCFTSYSMLSKAEHNGQIENLKQADMFVGEITAYTAGYESCGKMPNDPLYGITASGIKVREGIIATDTRYIPFGTKVYIEGLGVFESQDRGGDIKGNRIDIYMDNLNDALKFGRQFRNVIILGK